jgi:large subunit ribosomal protein L4
MSYDITVLDNSVSLKQKVSSFAALQNYTIKQTLLAQVIRCELSNLRTGNAHAKTRAEVRGGGKKPWKQKGTGRARHGSIRSPIWVGGGAAWGPRNTVNWHLKINKSARVSALKSIIKDRLESTSVYRLENDFAYPKTKEASNLLDKFSQATDTKIKKLIIIYSSTDKINLNGFPNTEIKMINVQNLKIHKLAGAEKFIFTPSALEFLNTRLSDKNYDDVSTPTSKPTESVKKEIKEIKTVKEVTQKVMTDVVPAKTTKKADKTATDTAKDKLQTVEGIGPAIEKILNENNIHTFAQLAVAPVDQLKDILSKAGSRYSIHNPATWPQQAELARDGKMDELKQWQEKLDGGK